MLHEEDIGESGPPVDWSELENFSFQPNWEHRKLENIDHFYGDRKGRDRPKRRDVDDVRKNPRQSSIKVEMFPGEEIGFTDLRSQEIKEMGIFEKVSIRLLALNFSRIRP
jgi:hypothetical protein